MAHKERYAYTGIAKEMAVLLAGTGAANLLGGLARKMTAANIGERARCVME